MQQHVALMSSSILLPLVVQALLTLFRRMMVITDPFCLPAAGRGRATLKMKQCRVCQEGLDYHRRNEHFTPNLPLGDRAEISRRNGFNSMDTIRALKAADISAAKLYAYRLECTQTAPALRPCLHASTIDPALKLYMEQGKMLAERLQAEGVACSQLMQQPLTTDATAAF